MSEPLTLSIVTPSYNTGAYLGAAINSVLAQNWPRTQFIVMDGGSTDGSLDVLRSFGDRIEWVSEKDKGQSDAINKGFAKLGGDVLGWLNSDDTFAPGAFRAAITFLQDHTEIDLVYGNANFIDANGSLIGPCMHIEPYKQHRLFHYSDFIVQPAAFFRRSAFDAAGGLDTSLNWTMDYELWLQIAKRSKVAYLPTLLANYRWLKSNKTATGGFDRLREVERVMARHGLGLPAYNRLEWVNLHLEAARRAIRERRAGYAAASLARAVGNTLRSPRAMVSMFQPRTWKIIWTGQVLRKRALNSGGASSIT